MAKNTPEHDPETGELLPTAARHNPFAQRSVTAVMAGLHQGRPLAAIDRGMTKIRQVLNKALARDEDATGTITIKLSFKTNPAKENLDVVLGHTITLPAPKKAKGTLFIDAEGQFSSIHPTQLDLSLRVVPTHQEARAAPPPPAAANPGMHAPPPAAGGVYAPPPPTARVPAAPDGEPGAPPAA